MNPPLFEIDLLERRRHSAGLRRARPDEPADDTPAPYTLGYPRRALLLRALLPIALAFLLFFTYGP